jgi:hypothetical protein
MPDRIVPMIHVPDVQATADWYASIGFEVRDLGRECDAGEVVFALLALDESCIMLSAGGQPNSAHRREFDLYIHTTNVDERYGQLKDRVDIVEPPHDTLCGARVYPTRLQPVRDL